MQPTADACLKRLAGYSAVEMLFPSLPFAPASPDPDFAAEYVAARAAGFRCSLYELESLRAGDLRNAFRRCPPAPTPDTPLVYRGWMLSDTHYTRLYDALRQRGYRPITAPDAYAEAHYLPLAYTHLRGFTPQSVWMEGTDREQAWQTYQQLADGPAIIKDYVKSAKHRWREACFLPARTSRATFDAIVDAFLEARGTLFEHGLVFRRYHPLVELGEDMRGKPTHEEYRLFCVDGRIIAHTPFLVPAELESQRTGWEHLAGRFSNRFITLDVARETDGGWVVVEAGDGGVSGLPYSIPPDEFYAALWNALAAG